MLLWGLGSFWHLQEGQSTQTHLPGSLSSCDLLYQNHCRCAGGCHETEAILEFTEVQAKLFGAYRHLAEGVGNKAVAPPFKARLG